MQIEQTESAHGAKQFKPNTTVAAIVHCQGKFLVVEEIEHGKRVFNQPAGHIEANESLVCAIKRELKEETGLRLEPDYLSGVYYFHRSDLSLYFLRFCFVFELEEQQAGTPEDDEILANHWFSYDEIIEKNDQLRSAMVLDCIEDYLSGQKMPLSMLKSNL
ncbi:NUDIX hydrolase [Thalassotalea atypica]|uniref:NUDIX hydrolase n=1 Tax=Thalassotalea atypica TaxID=2054316 RepID=UPI002572B56C|nr:NUDIX hydrolase [Thalassotalea atypica]